MSRQCAGALDCGPGIADATSPGSQATDRSFLHFARIRAMRVFPASAGPPFDTDDPDPGKRAPQRWRRGSTRLLWVGFVSGYRSIASSSTAAAARAEFRHADFRRMRFDTAGFDGAVANSRMRQEEFRLGALRRFDCLPLKD
jgi:hypothetical protein